MGGVLCESVCLLVGAYFVGMAAVWKKVLKDTLHESRVAWLLSLWLVLVALVLVSLLALLLLLHPARASLFVGV